MANGDDAISFISLLGCFVLVLSALLARRIPVGQGLKMALAWLLIFLAVFVAFTLKDDFVALGKRVVGESVGGGQVARADGALRIRRAKDGHFWAAARINDVDVRFLIDSGATVTAISAETARRAGVEASGGLPVVVETANGFVQSQRGRVARLSIGDLERSDLAVHISDALATDLLGMNFLSSLSGWRVEGEWLILQP